jgi:hypothetical protein
VGNLETLYGVVINNEAYSQEVMLNAGPINNPGQVRVQSALPLGAQNQGIYWPFKLRIRVFAWELIHVCNLV